MYKFLISFFLLLNTLLFSAETLKKVSLKLNWLNQFQFAGYIIAKEKGFYKKYGIDLKIEEFNNELNVVDDILNRKYDFAIGHSSIIIDKINGKDIIGIAAIFQDNPLILLTKKRDDIKEINDLKSKKIMITDDAINTASIMAMLYASKIKKEDINFVSHSFKLEDLINDKVDAMASFSSNEPLILASENIPYTIFSPNDYGFNFYSDILYTSSDFIKKNEELTKNFYKATLEGWEYAFKNIIETSKIIFNKYNSQNKSLISLIEEGEVLKKLSYVSYINNKEKEIKIPLGSINNETISNTINSYKLLGLISPDSKLEGFVYKENQSTNLDYELTNHHILMIIIILIILLILYVKEKISKDNLIYSKNELEINFSNINLENKKNQELLFHQSKYARMGEMINNIAHQWRQPLNRINLSTQVILELLEDKSIDKEEIKKRISNIKKNLYFMSNTIDDFSNFFRPNKEKEYFDINVALDQSIALLSNEFKDIYLNISYLDKQSVYVNGYKNEFIHILIVILKNACDNFKLTNVKNKEIKITIAFDNESKIIVLSILDNSGGIKPSIINNIFEPYFSTKFKKQGTGIGLYMAKMIIEESMNGKIWVESKNKTTTFSISLKGKINV